MNSYNRTFEGIVTSVSNAADQRSILYTILSDKVICATSPLVLDVGDVVDVKAVKVGQRASIEKIEIVGEATVGEIDKSIGRLPDMIHVRENVEKMVEKYVKDAPYSDGVLKIAKDVEKAAGAFAAAYMSGAEIIVRFHNDCDGASGAISIYRALAKVAGEFVVGRPSVLWVMQRGIEYDRESAYSDILEFRNHKSAVDPLLLITDFGTTPGSEDQINNPERRHSMIMLDHHPPYPGFPRRRILHYLNPWDYGMDSSFTAGLLSSLFAEALAPIDTADMINASLIGDFSEFANRSDAEGQKLSIVLDYLTSVAGRIGSGIDRLTPGYAESIIKDRERLDSIYYSASGTLNELLDMGIERVKKLRGKFADVFVLDFSELPKSESGYPLPGRYSSRLQEKLEAINGIRTILVLHYGSYITIRLPRKISKEVALLDKINSILKSSEYAESGGGHNEAASIKVDKKRSGEVLSLLLMELGCPSYH